MLWRYWLPSLISYNISVDIGSTSDSSLDDITSISFSLNNVSRVEPSYDSLLLYVPSQVLDNKFPYSNCAYVIILPVCSIEDIAQGMYDTAGHIAIASEYGCDVYANAL